MADAVAAAEAFLLSAQDGDGYFRDYVLPPGAAEAWVTAVVVAALQRAPRDVRVGAAAARGTLTLARAFLPGGWGYNRATPPDADSTAWCVLAASPSRYVSGARAMRCLLDYVDAEGHAHTYRVAQEHDGWSTRHADVTPVVGLALRACGADAPVLGRIRNAVLQSRAPGGTWRSYWWTTDTYAAAWSLRFLEATGGCHLSVKREVCQALGPGSAPESDFEAAHRLMVGMIADSPAMVAPQLCYLLDQQTANGSWRPSEVLKLPSGQERSPVEATEPAPSGPDPDSEPRGSAQNDYDRVYADIRGIMTTAVAVHALKQWLHHA